MSATIDLSAADARELFGTLSILVPSKTEATPIGLQLTNNKLSLTFNNGFIASYEKLVSCEDEWSTTFMYQDIHSLLTYEENVIIICDQYGITVSTSEFECVLPIAYSEIGYQNFDEYTIHDMPEMESSAIKLILKLGLEKLYRTTYPVYVRNGIAIIKYPSFYAQVRLTEPFDSISMSLTHWSIIEKFRPTAYSQDNPKCLMVRNGAWTLMIPCTSSQQDNNFMKLLDDMNVIFKMSLHDYADSVRTISRVKGTDYCDVTVFQNGMKTTTHNANISTSLLYGDTSSEMVSTFALPISVWLAMLTAIGDTTAELMLGGGKLCLRNHVIAMLLRVAA